MLWHRCKNKLYIHPERKPRSHHAAHIRDPDSVIQIKRHAVIDGRESARYVFSTHAKHATQYAGRGVGSMKGESTGYRGTDWIEPVSFFYLFFFNFFLLPVRSDSINGVTGLVDGWMDGRIDGRRMVVRSHFGLDGKMAVGGPRWSLPSSLVFPEHPSRRVGREVPSGPVLPSRPGALRVVHKMRPGARVPRRLVPSLARTHARTHAVSERTARTISGATLIEDPV